MAHARELAGFGAILAGVTAVVAWEGTRVFDFFDMSVLMDAGWRVACGQQIYRDFYFNAGPVHPYLHALFFRLFGFGTAALLAHVAVLNAAVMAATWVAVRRELPAGTTALCTLAAGLCFYGIIAHPWYNQSACFFVVLAALCVMRLQPLDGARRAALAGFAAGVGCGLAVLTRVDFGTGASATFAIALASAGPRRGAALGGLAAGLAVGIGAVFATLPVGEFLFQMSEYVPRSRLVFWPRLVEVAGRTPSLALLAAALVARRRCGPRNDPVRTQRFWLLAGLLGTSFLTGYTSYMRLSSNCPLLATELLLLALLAGERGRRLVNVLLVGAVAAAVYLMHTHDVWAWRRSNLGADYPLKSAPMAGWLCERRMGEAVDAAVAAIATRVPRGDSLFVFPDTTVIYALAGRESWRGAPAIFLLGARESSPPPGALTERFRTQFLNQPPRWIVLHHERESPITDTARFLERLALDKFLHDRYRRVAVWNDIELLRLEP